MGPAKKSPAGSGAQWRDKLGGHDTHSITNSHGSISPKFKAPLPASPTPSRRPNTFECALASSRVATRPARVIGPLTVSDQNQRKLSGPPRVW